MRRLGWALILAMVALNLVVDAQSVTSEWMREGHRFAAWEPWLIEGSSTVGWLVVIPIVARAVERLRPPRLSWPRLAALAAVMTVPFSLLHVGVMVAVRKAAYALVGEGYALTPDLGSALLYEWRKDALDLITMAAVFGLIGWLARRADAPAAPAAPDPPTIEVRDGPRTLYLRPDEIVSAQAAGNYVELATAHGPLLHRATLAALEERLGPHGFARIHRSRLVRRAAVRGVETNASGDFELLLDGGARLGGSRRYRSRLDGG